MTAVKTTCVPAKKAPASRPRAEWLHEQLQGPVFAAEFLSAPTDTAVRLARYFDTSPEVWLNLQTAYDLKTLPTLDEIESRVTPRAA